MTVERLIKLLQTFPVNQRVVVYDDEYASYIDLNELKEREITELQDATRRVISHDKQKVVVI
jgi:hypothetical protein